jgi:hypothetical protein
MLQLLVTVNVVPSLLIPFTLMMEEMLYSETSVLTGATLRHIAEDGILQGTTAALQPKFCAPCLGHSARLEKPLITEVVKLNPPYESDS